MAANWSLSSNWSLHPESFFCLESNVFISTTVFLTTRSALVFPFSAWVLYLAHQRWRQQRPFKAMSHSDVIACNMAAMQLFGAPGTALYLFGVLLPQLSIVGVCISSTSIVGEILFHLLTCVERYLAVVYPVTYLKLKNTKGVRMRNVCIGGVWLFALGWSGQIVAFYPDSPFITFFCFSGVVFLIVSFCSLSVLWALIRPKPGEVGGDRVNQKKKKAFNTIVAITAATWLLFLGYFLCISLRFWASLSYSDWCLVVGSTVWFSLPSSLVVPLLFLVREEKISCC